MEIIDYNGEGEWSSYGILARYDRYCKGLGVEPHDIAPLVHSNGLRTWVYPVMDKVIKCIETGDAACKLIGIEFIEQDQLFAFGGTLKSNTARALRRCELTDEDKERIRTRVVNMLVACSVPREYKEYAKLLRKIGIGEHWERIERQIDRTNPYVMRYYNYFLHHTSQKP
jgi:hypothetical protein